MLNKVNVGIEFKKQEYSENELNLVNDIFGIFTKNVYFKIGVDTDLEHDDKFVNFFGISGSGKTVIKDLIKEQLKTEGKNV
jgi:predicted ribonuclease YlaK